VAAPAPILHVVGARPQFVKAAAILAVADPARHALIHTGQHYDANLSDVFFTELGMRPPAHALGIGSGTHGAQTGRMLAAIEAILLAAPAPGVMVVYGDTNSTLAAALAASKLHWPVAHIEAGLRSFDRRMPEEINRIATDHISDLLLCPTHAAVQQLAQEGRAEQALFTGDVMLDLAQRVAPLAKNTAIGRHLQTPGRAAPGALSALPAPAATQGGYALATVHRPANTDDPQRLAQILTALSQLPWPVLLPLHPRTRHAMTRHGLQAPPGLYLAEPAGPLDFAALIAGSALVLTDSGGVQKEAIFAGRRCVTLRDTTEWPETLADGWNVLVDADPEAIIREAQRPQPQSPPPIAPFGAGDAAQRIVRAVEQLLRG
jgi:UDP-N-acetylglucosamine 2-epimerase